MEIGKGLEKGYEAMLHKAEGAKPESCNTRDSVGSPMSVYILLNCLVENTIATIERIRNMIKS